jgi:uncharacterized protein YuzB (UPF0349 family)
MKNILKSTKKIANTYLTLLRLLDQVVVKLWDRIIQNARAKQCDWITVDEKEEINFLNYGSLDLITLTKNGIVVMVDDEKVKEEETHKAVFEDVFRAISELFMNDPRSNWFSKKFAARCNTALGIADPTITDAKK